MDKTYSITTSIEKLEHICKTVPVQLQLIDEKIFNEKPTEKWSKKEILGHLIDSATNNHHRIVRGQFEVQPKITYNNDTWNNGNHYLELDTDYIISFWTAYNKFLVELIKHIPPEKLTNTVETGEEGNKSIMTLAFIIDDYVVHLEYHLKQILNL